MNLKVTFCKITIFAILIELMDNLSILLIFFQIFQFFTWVSYLFRVTPWYFIYLIIFNIWKVSLSQFLSPAVYHLYIGMWLDFWVNYLASMLKVIISYRSLPVELLVHIYILSYHLKINLLSHYLLWSIYSVS